MDNWFDKLKEIAEGLYWSVSKDKDEITLGKFSPAGQDFGITIKADSFDKAVEEIKEICDNYDCSEETYLWLDSTGHGANGAPYDMKDLYEDMEACLYNMQELVNELTNIEE